jgi:hypothetical protein
MGQQKTNKNRWSFLAASVSGEMKPQDIPVAPGVDVEAIKAGDDDPLEVVVEVPAGKSTKGWNYTPESLKAIVDHVNTATLCGIKGHQKPEDVNSEFVAPATHWIGARMEGNRAYFRGVVDAAEKDLKRWIRSGRIKQVSIFGMPKLQTVAGETQVIGYKPLSIDWTPLDRMGMPTRIVAMGEMDDYEDDNKGGQESMDWKELIAQLKAKIGEGAVTLQDVIAALDEAQARKTKEALALLEQVKQALGVTDDSQLVAQAQAAAKALTDAAQQQLEQEVSNTVREKVAGEMAQDFILKLVKPKAGQTKETIAGEIDTLLEDDSIKAMLGRLHGGLPRFVGGSGVDNRSKDNGGNDNQDMESVPI